MISQRIGVSALRQASKPAVFAQHVPRLALTQARFASTEKLSAADADTLLDAQRKRRPVSPHLTIYKRDQTFFTGSIWQRITGAGFAGGVYAFSAAYLVAPLLGWHLESASLAAAVAALPLVVKGGLKFLVAWPFVYHLVNGVRHLVYDLGYGFAKATFATQGWAIWGASLVGGLYLGFLY